MYDHTGLPELARIFLDRTLGQEINWESEHFKDTPKRFIKMLEELTTQVEFNFTAFESTTDEMVVIKDIPFTSLCAHHVIPFIGYCHIGYVPNGKIAGLSKFARLVEYKSRRLTVQEELTRDICSSMVNELVPAGAIVVMEAKHLCMSLRGAKVPDVTTVTSQVFGVFGEHDRTAKAEFTALIADRKKP